jgi:hypothetical protein
VDKPSKTNNMQTLRLTSRFTLVVLITKRDKEKLDKMLTDNSVAYTEWRKHPMDGFIEFRVYTNIKGAEVIRQLLKNIKVYD